MTISSCTTGLSFHLFSVLKSPLIDTVFTGLVDKTANFLDVHWSKIRKCSFVCYRYQWELRIFFPIPFSFLCSFPKLNQPPSFILTASKQGIEYGFSVLDLVDEVMSVTFERKRSMKWKTTYHRYQRTIYFGEATDAQSSIRTRAMNRLRLTHAEHQRGDEHNRGARKVWSK